MNVLQFIWGVLKSPEYRKFLTFKLSWNSMIYDYTDRMNAEQKVETVRLEKECVALNKKLKTVEQKLWVAKGANRTVTKKLKVVTEELDSLEDYW